MPKSETKSEAKIYNDWTGTWDAAGSEHAERVARHEADLNPPAPPSEPPPTPTIDEIDAPVVSGA